MNQANHIQGEPQTLQKIQKTFSLKIGQNGKDTKLCVNLKALMIMNHCK